MRTKGSSLVELMAGSLVLLPIFLYAIDYASIFWAQQQNVNVCRDAARAAAQGPPTMFCPGGNSDAYRPYKRAQAVITHSSNPMGLWRVEPSFNFVEKLEAPYPQAPFGGPVRGWVRVSTTCSLNPPFKLPFVDKVVALKEEEQFPVTWVMPTNYNGTAADAGKSMPSGGAMPDGGGGPPSGGGGVDSGVTGGGGSGIIDLGGGTPPGGGGATGSTM